MKTQLGIFRPMLCIEGLKTYIEIYIPYQ